MRKNLSNEDRNKVAQWLFQHSTNLEVLPRKLQEAAFKYGMSKRAIRNIWYKAQQQLRRGEPIWLVNQKSNIRSKRVMLDREKMVNLSCTERSSLVRLSNKLAVSRTTCWRWRKQGLIKAHTNAIKSALTFEGRLLRLGFGLKHVHEDPSSHNLKFKSMQHIVHIDEKWFNLTKESLRYYVAEGEEEVYRTCHSKRFITKVMFMCAVARPIYDENGQMLFDGKIGMFPFIEKIAAKRKSKNRPAGTLETKPIASVTREVIKNCLINQVLPALKAKWPEGMSKDILIQQDNCRAHINDDDPDFRAAASADGFNIHLVFQPPNSPDTNVNDLGWFRALQSLKDEELPLNADDLIESVLKSFENLEPFKLNKVFLTYQSCLIEIMKKMGCNRYMTPHLGKDALIRQGLLPTDLEVDEHLVRTCIDYLITSGQTGGIKELMMQLGFETPL